MQMEGMGHRLLAKIHLQLVRHEALRRQLPQQLVQTQGLGLIVAEQVDMARAPRLGRKSAGQSLDRRGLRVILFAHQVKGHLAHQVDPVLR